MTGKDIFNPEFLDDLVYCFEKLDPKLLRSVNFQWKGLKAYAESNGTIPSDIWKRCTKDEKGTEFVKFTS